MKISQIEIYKLRIRLKEPFTISLGKLEFADNVLIVIKTDTGLTGFGESSPFMTINGESSQTGIIVAGYLGKALQGKNPLEIETCSNIMDKVIFGNTSIKSAFDIALYDIAAKHADLPLYAFLGGTNKKTLYTDYTVSLGHPEKMATDALKIKKDGFPVIKVKLGGSGESDIERMRQIRKAVGTVIPIRIDANQGWDFNTAAFVLNEIADMNIQFCEEPIPRWAFMELPELKRKSPVPVMADESCLDHHDAGRLIGLNACNCFNVKLGKSSGIYKALKIIKLAEEAGMKMQVGGFLESRIGFTASAHLALTSENICYCDFDSPLMFTENPVEGGIEYQNNGLVIIPEVPGLGASIPDNYLKNLDKIIIK
jgi:L-Ala-D/L-Glu epimerase